MRVLLDEDVHIGVMDWLRQSGHDVVRVPSGLKNVAVLALAICETRLLVTRDKDFANRLMYPPAKCPGIAVLRIHPPKLESLVAALQSLLGQVDGEMLKGKLAIIEESGYHLLA